MTSAEFKQRRQQLLDKFLAGEIDKPTYDSLMRELQEVSSIDLASADISITPDGTRAAERPPIQGLPPQPMPEVGMELGGFRFERRLGRGGMGEVWLAYDVVAERSVVIKLLQSELQQCADEMAAVKESFRRIHSLQHQNICPVYLLGQDPRFGYFIVMKYIDGVTLSFYRKSFVSQRGSFPLSEVVRLLAPVAKGLDYAHAAHVLHRDVKPQNIMVTRDGQTVQLVDFGLSADIRSSLSRISSSSIDLAGTYPYMAPEQWRGELLDARADQYALAVTAYELIAGRRPFEAADPAVLKMCALDDAPPRIDGVPDHVHDALLKGLAKSKQDRFPNCLAFVAALARDTKAVPQRTEPDRKRGAGAGISPSAIANIPSSVSEVRGSETLSQPTKRLPSAEASPPVTSNARGANPSRRATTDEDLLDPSEVLEPVEFERVRPNKGGQKPARELREMARPSITQGTGRRVNESALDEDDTEDASDSSLNVLQEANRRASFWVGLIGGIGVVSIASVFVLALWGSGLLTRGDSAGILQGNGSSLAENSNGNKEGPNGRKGNSGPDVGGEKPLRYQWQPGHSYVYSVNVDVEQSFDTTVSLTGNLTYSAMTPPVVAPIKPGEEDKGTGTAFVVHPDGYLLTCEHVVGGAGKIEVALGGKTYEAVVLAADDIRDIALIRVDAKGLPALALANSSAVEIGEDVRAVGFPLSNILGEGIKMTRGTLSGINVDEGQTVFQVDAGINPGNSGGPLINERGDVVGVNFAKLLSDVATNVGFAVPIDDAKKMLAEYGVKFIQGGGGSKLEGPALIKKVSVSTALVTVTSGGGAANGSRITLSCDGSLTPQVRSHGGGAGDPFAGLNLQRQMMFSSMRGISSEPDQVDTDSIGRIHGVRGSKNLPSFLGRVARLIVEELPAGRQKSWTQSHPVSITITQEDDGPMGGLPFGPRFRPRFGGFPGFPGNEPKTQQFMGTFKAVYSLGEKVGPLQAIKKTIEVKTKDALAAGPRIHLHGEGVFTINTETGLPQELDFKATLVENEAEKSTKTPLKLTYKLIEALSPEQQQKKRAEGAGGAGGFQANPVVVAPKPGSEQPGDAVEEKTELKVGQKLLAEWANQWYPIKVLAVNQDGTVRIHWEGWADSFDETLPRKRLRFPLSPTPAAQDSKEEKKAEGVN